MDAIFEVWAQDRHSWSLRELDQTEQLGVDTDRL
jgi:hypothetical protein